MSVLPLNLARVSNLTRSSLVTSSVSRTQAQLAQVQNELTTGKRLNRPSDDPGDSSAAIQLQKVLEQRKAYADNIDAAKGQLSEVDSTLGDLSALLQQAQTIASANVGSDVTPDARKSAAAVVQSIYQQAVSLGNKQFNGVYLFGGDKATEPPFEVGENGGVKFVGSGTTLLNRVDENASLSFMANGAEVFGATSTRITGTADLTPGVTAATRLSDLRGAANEGVKSGSIVVGNGTISTTVDLSHADTLGDVVTAINAAAVGGITAAIGGGNLVLTGGGGDNITVNEVSGGSMASQLGILTTTGSGAGVPVTGTATQPLVTDLTPLTALNGGAGIDVASGLTITSGTKTVTVNFTSPPLRLGATVGDLLNAINDSGADVTARINAAGTGIDIINPNQGAQMTVSENGGTTAADLGVRSLNATTPLSELNFGKGVKTVAGDDLSITRSDGTNFTVDLDGAATIQDVIDKINTADTLGTMTASVAATGNGIVLTDTAGGVGAPGITALNFSTALKDLGLDVTATGTVLTGRDVNPVAAQGVFANLAALRDALENNDAAAITESGEHLQTDYDRVVRTRGETGARVQEFESRKDRLDDQNIATQALLSELQDTDFTSAIAKFETLQTSLQAAMQAGGRSLSLSLMDFLG
ncbi:flagellar hook-associated protein FlgL [Humisphaera borealis]|uniref:Flagellar hook-associated protein FlgL n=1 Tax=Humisphaera borealis TaxID=2807512 RepID=A0A7M2X3C9_9BACT|nr:flagellar hook-associated protein FlgL [Humisphaera borealis]QOV91521.1 flagellar hook-associated protein FlgL [Humisphaera borealis]